MNYSTCLTLLAASAVGPVAAELEQGFAEMQRRTAELVGSFFGGRPLARRGAGVRAATAIVDAGVGPAGHGRGV